MTRRRLKGKRLNPADPLRVYADTDGKVYTSETSAVPIDCIACGRDDLGLVGLTWNGVTALCSDCDPHAEAHGIS